MNSLRQYVSSGSPYEPRFGISRDRTLERTPQRSPDARSDHRVSAWSRGSIARL